MVFARTFYNGDRSSFNSSCENLPELLMSLYDIQNGSFLPFSEDGAVGMDKTAAELLEGNEVEGDVFFGFTTSLVVFTDFEMTPDSQRG